MFSGLALFVWLSVSSWFQFFKAKRRNTRKKSRPEETVLAVPPSFFNRIASTQILSSWLLLTPGFAPDFWRQARELSKQGSEVALVFESGAETDFDDRQIFREQLFCALDALLH